MSDRWVASQDLHDELVKLIANHHPHLVELTTSDHPIVIIFKERSSKVGGKPVLGKTLKAPKILELLGEKNYSFILEVGDDAWHLLSEEQKIALLDHLLCFIGAEENEQNGEMSYYLKSPDIFYFQEEQERHGAWRIPGIGEPEKPAEGSPEATETKKKGKKTKPLYEQEDLL